MRYSPITHHSNKHQTPNRECSSENQPWDRAATSPRNQSTHTQTIKQPQNVINTMTRTTTTSNTITSPTNSTAIDQTNTEDSYEESDEEDEDTVVGNCLHCNRPPPPRSERGSGGTFTCTPCPASDPNGGGSGALVRGGSSNNNNNGGAANRVQVSCDDCRSFICDGEFHTV